MSAGLVSVRISQPCLVHVPGPETGEGLELLERKAPATAEDPHHPGGHRVIVNSKMTEKGGRTVIQIQPDPSTRLQMNRIAAELNRDPDLPGDPGPVPLRASLPSQCLELRHPSNPTRTTLIPTRRSS